MIETNFRDGNGNIVATYLSITEQVDDIATYIALESSLSKNQARTMLDAYIGALVDKNQPHAPAAMGPCVEGRGDDDRQQQD